MGKRKATGDNNKKETAENLQQYLARRVNGLREEYELEGRSWPPEEEEELERLRGQWLTEAPNVTADVEEADRIIQRIIEESIEATERRVRDLEQSILQAGVRRGRRIMQARPIMPPPFVPPHFTQPGVVLTRAQFDRGLMIPNRPNMPPPGIIFPPQFTQPGVGSARASLDRGLMMLGRSIMGSRPPGVAPQAESARETLPGNAHRRARLELAREELSAAGKEYRKAGVRHHGNLKHKDVQDARQKLNAAQSELALAEGKLAPDRITNHTTPTLLPGELQRRYEIARHVVAAEEKEFQQLEKTHQDDPDNQEVLDAKARLERDRRYLAHVSTQLGAAGEKEDISKESPKTKTKSSKSDDGLPATRWSAHFEVVERFRTLRALELDIFPDDPENELIIDARERLQRARQNLHRITAEQDSSTTTRSSRRSAAGGLKSRGQTALSRQLDAEIKALETGQPQAQKSGDKMAALGKEGARKSAQLTEDEVRSRFYSARALVTAEENTLRDLEREFPDDPDNSDVIDATARVQSARRYLTHMTSQMEAAGLAGRATADWPNRFIEVQSEVQAAEEALQRLKFHLGEDHDGPDVDAAIERVSTARQNRERVSVGLLTAAMRGSRRTGSGPADDWSGRYARLQNQLDSAYQTLRKLHIRFPKGDPENPEIRECTERANRARDEMSRLLAELHRASVGARPMVIEPILRPEWAGDQHGQNNDKPRRITRSQTAASPASQTRHVPAITKSEVKQKKAVHKALRLTVRAPKATLQPKKTDHRIIQSVKNVAARTAAADIMNADLQSALSRHATRSSVVTGKLARRDAALRRIERMLPELSSAAQKKIAGKKAPVLVLRKGSHKAKNGRAGKAKESQKSASPDRKSSGDAMVHHIDLRRQGTPTGPPQHTESGRRVVLVRQWLRDCHSLLDRIRSPSQGTRLSADSQTPEARAASQTLPQIHTEALSVAISSGGGAVPPPVPAPRPAGTQATPARAANPAAAAAGTPTTNSQSAARPAQPPPPQGTNNRPRVPIINPDVEVLGSLWREVDALQSRLHPHMHRYRDLLAEGGASGCPGHNQHLFNVVQAVTHSLAHIYHSMSDLACDFGPEGNRQLTAAVAPAPPPTAIIHQNIPITIPLRATVNVSNRNNTSNTSTRTTRSTGVNSQANTAADTEATTVTPSAGNAASQTPAVGQMTQTAEGVFTSIEVDMETDDPEDPVLSTAGSGPAGLAGGVPSVAGSGPGGFNLSQIIQDAFGLAGLPTPPGLAAGNTSRSQGTTTTTPASAATTGAGGFIPPPGSATPGNGPLLPGQIPAGLLPPNGASQTPKDRLDPYLTSCSSKHWQSPAPVSHRPHPAPSSGAQARSNSSRGPQPNNTHRATTQQQRPTARSNVNTPVIRNSSTTAAGTPRATPTAAQRSTPTSTASKPRVSSSPTSGSRASPAAGTASSGTPSEVLKRRFFEELSSSMTEAATSQPWTSDRSSGISHRPFASMPVQALIVRLQEIFRNASLNRENTHITELNNLTMETFRPAAERGINFLQLGLLDELARTIFRDLTITDLFHAFIGHGQSMDRFRMRLRGFARSNVLQDGPPTNDNVSSAVRRILYKDPNLSLPTTNFSSNCVLGIINSVTQQRTSRYDIGQSMCNLIEVLLKDMINFLISSKEGTQNFGQQLLNRLTQGLRRFMRLAYEICSINHEDAPKKAAQIACDLIRHCTHNRLVLGDAFVSFAERHLIETDFVSSIWSISLSEVEEYLVLNKYSGLPPATAAEREAAERAGETSSRTKAPAAADSMQTDVFEQAQEALDTPHAALTVPAVNGSAVTPPDNNSRTSPAPINPNTLTDASPQNWRNALPADWVAIIEEDIKRQMELNASDEENQPLSQAYLDGRPQKRRRMNGNDEDDDLM